MSWQSWRIQDVVWRVGYVNHAIDEWEDSSRTFMWETACGIAKTDLTTSGGKKPRVFKGFVTCFQCLAKGPETP